MRAVLLGAASLVLVACSRPAPPTLTPKQAVVTGVTPTALGLELTLDATNPNAVDITASDVSAHVVLDKHIDVGVALVEQTVNLPANQTTELKLAVSVPWNNVVPLLALAVSDRRPMFPYAVDGTLSLGGDLLHMSVPFHLEGNVSKDQLVRATVNSIPAIPSVTAPGASASGGAPGANLPPGNPPQGRRGPRPFK